MGTRKVIASLVTLGVVAGGVACTSSPDTPAPADARSELRAAIDRTRTDDSGHYSQVESFTLGSERMQRTTTGGFRLSDSSATADILVDAPADLADLLQMDPDQLSPNQTHLIRIGDDLFLSMDAWTGDQAGTWFHFTAADLGQGATADAGLDPTAIGPPSVLDAVDTSQGEVRRVGHGYLVQVPAGTAVGLLGSSVARLLARARGDLTVDGTVLLAVTVADGRIAAVRMDATDLIQRAMADQTEPHLRDMLGDIGIGETMEFTFTDPGSQVQIEAPPAGVTTDV